MNILRNKLNIKAHGLMLAISMLVTPIGHITPKERGQYLAPQSRVQDEAFDRLPLKKSKLAKKKIKNAVLKLLLNQCNAPQSSS